MKIKSGPITIDDILKEKGVDICSCGQKITQGDIAWNNGSTEYGTPHCTVFCQCPKCDSEIFHFFSWYPSIEDTYDLCYVLDSEL